MEVVPGGGDGRVRIVGRGGAGRVRIVYPDGRSRVVLDGGRIITPFRGALDFDEDYRSSYLQPHLIRIRGKYPYCVLEGLH